MGVERVRGDGGTMSGGLMEDVEQDWSLDPGDRWVRLMADVFATGLWHRDGTLDVAESLPISRELMIDIL